MFRRLNGIRIQAMVWGKCQDAGKCHSSNDLNTSSMPVSHVYESICSIHWNRHLTFQHRVSKTLQVPMAGKRSSVFRYFWMPISSVEVSFFWFSGWIDSYDCTRFWWRFAVLCSAILIRVFGDDNCSWVSWCQYSCWSKENFVFRSHDASRSLTKPQLEQIGFML